MNRRRAITLTGTAAAVADLVPPVTVEDYAAFTVQLTGTFVGSVQFQGSNDGTNWIALRGKNAQDATNVIGAATTTGMWQGALGCKFFRLTCAAYTSGTVVGSVTLHPEAIATTVKST